MHILYITPGVFDKGGISRYTRYQIRALRELLGEQSVTVLSLLSPDEHGFEVPFRVDFSSFGVSPRGKALLAVAAAVVAATQPLDVVWTAHLHMAPLGLGVARLTRARSVVNVYGAETWTNVTRIRAAAVRRVDHVISDCHATLEHVVGSGLRGAQGNSVHWDCVDLAQFRPGKAEIPARYGVPKSDGQITVLTLARLGVSDRHKGVDRLIDVFAALPRDLPVRLVVAGDGSGRPALERRAQASGVSDRVHFTGRITEGDLADVYRSCDVFSLITNKGPGIGEGIPLTPLEAAACGKPILVGNQDGSREAAEDEVSGFVLDPFRLDQIGDRIVRLAGDRDLREGMGERARERVEREHSFERFRERLDDLLRVLGITPKRAK